MQNHQRQVPCTIYTSIGYVAIALVGAVGLAQCSHTLQLACQLLTETTLPAAYPHKDEYQAHMQLLQYQTYAATLAAISMPATPQQPPQGQVSLELSCLP
jgi:hypothetical protein